MKLKPIQRQSVSSKAVCLTGNNQFRCGFTLVELCVVVIIIGILVALLLPMRRTAGEAGRRMQCTNNLKQIALALRNYHEAYGCLPPAYTVDQDGNRLHSWRTMLLPFLEEKRLYDQIDLSKPWDDPVNRQAIAGHVPSVFRCPTSKDQSKTSYQVVVDPESCFPGVDSVTLSQVSDGESNTLTVIEVSEGYGVEWMSPQDTNWHMLASVNEKTKFAHAGVFHAAFVDGHVAVLPNKSSVSVRRSLLTIAAGDKPEYDVDQ